MLKPTRFYRTVTFPNGDFHSLQMLFGPQGPELDAMITGDGAVTVPEVVALLDRMSLPYDRDTPSEIAHRLNVMRVTADPWDEGVAPAHIEGPLQRILKATETLMEDLPKVISACESIPVKPGFTEAMSGFLTAVSRADSHFFRGPRRKRYELWNDDAVLLAIILQDVAARSGREIGLAQETGAAIRFIEGALRRAGVLPEKYTRQENPEDPCGAILAAWKKHKAKFPVVGRRGVLLKK